MLHLNEYVKEHPKEVPGDVKFLLPLLPDMYACTSIHDFIEHCAEINPKKKINPLSWMGGVYTSFYGVWCKKVNPEEIIFSDATGELAVDLYMKNMIKKRYDIDSTYQIRSIMDKEKIQSLVEGTKYQGMKILYFPKEDVKVLSEIEPYGPPQAKMSLIEQMLLGFAQGDAL